MRRCRSRARNGSTDGRRDERLWSSAPRVAERVMDRSFEELWETAPRATQRFDRASVAALPSAARRYLEHTLAPGAPLATAALVRMHGTIKVGGSWAPFDAEQVLRWDRGFVWRARSRMKGLPVSGADRFIDEEGSMRWKILGIVPVMTASGTEISRAAAGRFHAEAMWLPGALLSGDVTWTERDGAHPHAAIRAHGEGSELDLAIDAVGAIRAVSLPRWFAAADGAPGRYETFGGTCGDDRAFGLVTLPSTYSLGWFYGEERFETEGEFFRCTLDSVEHR